VVAMMSEKETWQLVFQASKIVFYENESD